MELANYRFRGRRSDDKRWMYGDLYHAGDLDGALYSGHRKVVFTFTPSSVDAAVPTTAVILVYAAPSEGMVFVTVEEFGPSAIWSTTLSAPDAEVLCRRLLDRAPHSGSIR